MAFLYFGARVDAGIPFNVHLEHNTSGWIGPFNLILAQDNNTTNTSATTMSLQPDKYVARYVKTPSTPFLQMHPGCTLFRQEDFERQMCATAVNETVHAQTLVGRGEDPYAPYFGNCSHGNVKPILPLYEFVFVPHVDKKTNKVVDQLQIKLDYKIMTMPHPKDIAYKLMPRLQSLFNNRKNGEFHISGPYCYGDDPHRGWTFDFNYDSQQPGKQFMSLQHGCVEDLPCVPTAGILGSIHDTHMIYYNSSSDGDNGNGTNSLDLDKIIISILSYILLLALVVSITCNCRQSRQVKRLQQQQYHRALFHHEVDENGNHDQEHPNGVANAGSSGMLLQPLLADRDEDDDDVFDGTDNLLAGQDDHQQQAVSNPTTTTPITESV
jgi:hypothetical protein